MQSHSFLALVAFGILGICGTVAAQQIYKWTDANGVIHYSQTPPAKGVHFTKVELSNAAGMSALPPTETPADSNNSDANQAAKAGTAPLADTPANRANFCTQVTANIALLQSQQPVIAGDDDGVQKVLTDASRKLQLDSALQQQKAFCTIKKG